jgi:hypothetical protein
MIGASPFCVIYVAMERYEERKLGMYTKCSKCHKMMASGQTVYVKITEDGNTVKIGAPICYTCKTQK